MKIEIVILAVIAAVILFQLYNVLGKRVGRQPAEDARDPAAADARLTDAAARPLAPVDPALAAAAAGLKARDPAFDPVRFLDGARQAYETVVQAYAAGDREALRPLLAPAVMESFEKGMAAREAKGESEAVEFVHPPRADLEAATAEEDRAVAAVRFLAEIRSRLTASDGAETTDERRTAEVWTFQRSIGAADPNWVLTRVAAATA